MAQLNLKEKTIEKIQDYLSGRINKKEASEWAISILTKETFNSNELLLEDAITALTGLHDEDDQFNTSDEDLEYFIQCLTGKAPYAKVILHSPYTLSIP